MTRHAPAPSVSGSATAAVRHTTALAALSLLLALLLLPGCGEDAPMGVSRDDLEGVWSGDLNNVTLMGRTLTGDVDWRFTRDTFEITFINPPVGGTERIGGDWKFSGGKVVLELRTSFPIQDDVGARDTLFVSILDYELSIKTLAGSDILLTRTALADAGRGAHDARPCRFAMPQRSRRSASISPASPSADRCSRAWSPARRWRPASCGT